MRMRALALLSVLGMALGVGGLAPSARADIIMFDPDGPGGPDPASNITGLDWAVGNALAKNSLPLTAGSTFQQGYLEASNVDMADAMVNVIDAQRSYQLDAKVITTQDQLMEIANGIRH